MNRQVFPPGVPNAQPQSSPQTQGYMPRTGPPSSAVPNGHASNLMQPVSVNNANIPHPNNYDMAATNAGQPNNAMPFSQPNSQPAVRPQAYFQPQAVTSPYQTPKALAQVAYNASAPGMNLLPPPSFPNQPSMSSPSSPYQSPGQSAPQSTKSSRNPSPLPTTSYDLIEGQFTPKAMCHSNSSNSLTENESVTPNSLPQGSNPRRNIAPLGTMPQLRPSLQNTPSPYGQVNGQSNPAPNIGQFNNYTTAANRYTPSSVPQTFNPSQNSPQNQYQPPNQPPTAAPSSNYPNMAPPTLLPNTTGPPHSGPTGKRHYPQVSTQTRTEGTPISGQHPIQPNSMPAPNSVPNQTPIQTSNSYPLPPSSQAMYPGQMTDRQNQFNGNYNQQASPDQLASKLGSMNLFAGSQSFNILQNKNVLPEAKIIDPHPAIGNPQSNCKPEIFRCTLNSMPESQSLLQKARVPLGILIHPFKDLSNLPVIQCSTIVRCRSCRTYINPFVYFVDQRKWKCNLCYKVNELPEEFLYDPVSKQYGDPSRRPEVKSATIEFIAPSEYMLRPPQPAVYLYLLDVSRSAIVTGYLKVFCDTLLAEIDNIPGDARTQIGFITYDSCLHFYNLAEGLSQPQMMVVSDVDDVFLPSPDNLLVNIHESKELVRDLLGMLPDRFVDNFETQNALGSALQAAYKLTAPTGGRITVVNTCLPSIGPGLLKPREDPNQRAGQDVQNLGPANDFYKKMALDCSGQQIAVDLFMLSSQYTDIATISCVSKFSGGTISYYPNFHAQSNTAECVRFKKDLHRYLTRKIGLEAVLRIRCTRGISIHTFHGNFFVRSTDLLSLPNVNPDTSFAMHMSIDESLSDNKTVCFQAALLYTSSKGERRIRVHTLCLPVTNSISDVIGNVDQQAIASLVSKMAVDRSLASSMPDARDALINVLIDAFQAFKSINPANGTVGLFIPMSLRLLPLYILAILKSVSFRVGTSTKLDERVYAMNQLKTLPLQYFIQSIYPDMYPVHAIEHYPTTEIDGLNVAQLPLLHLSSERTDRHGAYLLDSGKAMYLYVCSAISDSFCQNVLGVQSFAAISEDILKLPELDTAESKSLRSFIKHLHSNRPCYAPLRVIRDNSKSKYLFLQHIVEDRSESSYSYYEFLQHVQQQVNK